MTRRNFTAHAAAVLLLGVVLAGAAAMAADTPNTSTADRGYPPVPVVPAARASDVRGIVYARPFTLDTPHPYTFRADQPAITAGWLLVVEVTPELARLKDSWNPVLYVGPWPAEIAASDAERGRMVVIVPGEVDLARDPVFFGSVELPEAVTPERAEAEVRAAVAAGSKPLGPEALRTAREAGGDAARFGDARDLYAGAVADIIDAYAPGDTGRAAGYRVPRIGKP